MDSSSPIVDINMLPYEIRVAFVANSQSHRVSSIFTPCAPTEGESLVYGKPGEYTISNILLYLGRTVHNPTINYSKQHRLLSGVSSVCMLRSPAGRPGVVSFKSYLQRGHERPSKGRLLPPWLSSAIFRLTVDSGSLLGFNWYSPWPPCPATPSFFSTQWTRNVTRSNCEPC